MHAFGILNDVLEQLSAEGHFSSKTHFLGELVKRSETKLPWNDIAAIKQGIADRNGVAHKGVLLPRGICWKHIESIKTELVSWGIL